MKADAASPAEASEEGEKEKEEEKKGATVSKVLAASAEVPEDLAAAEAAKDLAAAVPEDLAAAEAPKDLAATVPEDMAASTAKDLAATVPEDMAAATATAEDPGNKVEEKQAEVFQETQVPPAGHVEWVPQPSALATPSSWEARDGEPSLVEPASKPASSTEVGQPATPSKEELQKLEKAEERHDIHSDEEDLKDRQSFKDKCFFPCRFTSITVI